MSGDTLTTAIAAVCGAALTAWATVKVAVINRSDARPQPDSVHPLKISSEMEARLEGWKHHSEEMVRRLVEAEVQISELRTADAAKEQRIAADADRIMRLATHVRELVAYIRVLIAEWGRSSRPPQPPEGLDLD